MTSDGTDDGPDPHHRLRLLETGRCGRCAEPISRSGILRGNECDHCGQAPKPPSDELLDQLTNRRLRWRLAAYGAIGLASFFAGTVPLLQSLFQICALVVLHVMVLRRGLRWLGMRRRIVTRLNIKLFGATLSAAAILLNVAVAPLVGLGAFVLATSGPLLAAVYVEGGLAMLRRGLRREVDGDSLQTIEWMLPAGLVAILVVAMLATAGLVAGVVHLLASMEIPGVDAITESVLEVFE